MCDQIEGLKGKALKGFLKILGKARMTQYRIVSEGCGSQYVLMETKKWFFSRKKNLTIGHYGTTEDGIDIKKEKEKEKLNRKIKIQYGSSDKNYLIIPSAQLEECNCN